MTYYGVKSVSIGQSFAGSRGQVRRAGGGQVTSLVPLLPQANGDPSGPGWFGPLEPMPEQAPWVRGRRNDFQSGWNQQQRPRQDRYVTYDQLRTLADSYDLVRLAIETRKDQMARLTWTIVPIDDKADMAEGSDLAVRAKRITDMFRRPDRENFWATWLRSLLEDLLVIDAATIHVRRTLDGSEVYSLDQIDGATIKRVIDDFGRQPQPPYAAYQQILKGMAAVNYTKLDLVYRPRNVRVHQFYGYSPVEQLMMIINIALRREMWQLSYFTDGNIPDSLIGVPSTWTPGQIAQFQDWFDSELSGNTEKRRGARFVPGEVAKSYTPTKEADLFGQAEEWLARVVCFCFGISHQALVKEVNKATSQTAQEQAIADGLAPIQNWVKELIDGIILDQLEETELEFQWVDDKEMDPKVQSEILQAELDRGVINIDQWLEATGREPLPDGKGQTHGTTALMTRTPIDTDEAIEQKQKMQDAFPPPPALAAGQPGQTDSRPPPGKPSADGGSAGGESASGAAKADDALARRVRKIDPAATPVSVGRAEVERVRLRATKRVARALIAAQALVEGQLDDILQGVGKGDVSHGSENSRTTITSAEVAEWAAGLDLTPLEDLKLAGDFTEVAEDTVTRAVAMIGVDYAEKLVDAVNPRAVAFAEQRAARLVGKRVLSDGTLIDNPNPEWAITDSTRVMMRDMITRSLEDNLGRDAIRQELEDSYAFSPSRAETVVRTELADVNSAAAMESYRGARERGTAVRKEWILGPEPCPICEDNADEGPIELDDEFPSGDDAAPAHPNCECAVVPVVGEDGEEGDEE